MKRHAGIALALLAAALLAGLGVWQVERRAWKLDLIARTQRRLVAAPAAMPPKASWPRIGRRDEYARLRVTGQWIAARPALVQALTDYGAGRWVIQPLATPDGVVLINRGFSPQDARATASAGPATVTGLLRLSEPGGGFLRRNDPARDAWYSRDVSAIARSRELGAIAPFFIDADASSTTGSPGAPRGGLTVVAFPNNHLIYAITWFVLSGMAGWFAWRLARAPERGTDLS